MPKKKWVYEVLNPETISLWDQIHYVTQGPLTLPKWCLLLQIKAEMQTNET